jgi:chromosomal replication initiation ATPase DnaA
MTNVVEKKIADLILLIPSEQQQYARRRIDNLVRAVIETPIPELKWQTINGEVESLNEQRVNNMMKVVCKLTHVDWSELKGKSRKREINDIRQTSMWILRKGTSLSFANIGAIFNRHHATVLHAVDSVNNMIQTDRMYRGHVEQILNHLDNENLNKAFDKLTD